MNNNAPIGVFDSGIGGLTVLETLKKMFPYEDFIYLADSAYVPYGTKTAEEVKNRVNTIAKEMIAKGVKAIIIACNTATANADELISNSVVPIIGVIEPTARRAYNLSKNKKIALLATDLTVKLGVYQKILANAEVFALASSVFVPLAESPSRNSEATITAVREHLSPLIDKDFDTIIYGCTHFGLLDKAIQKALPNKTIVDSGKATAEVLKEVMFCNNLANDLNVLGTIKLYTTASEEDLQNQITWFKEDYLGPYKW